MSFNNEKSFIKGIKLKGKVMTKEELAGFLYNSAESDTFIEIRGTKETIDRKAAIDFLLTNKKTSRMIDFVKRDIIIDVIIESPSFNIKKDLGELINRLEFDCYFVPENDCYIRTTKKGIPYVLCEGWGDEYTTSCFILYCDETGLRGYVPIYGNIINRYTNLSFAYDYFEDNDLLFALEEKLITKKEYDKALKDEDYRCEVSEKLLNIILKEEPDYDKMIEEIETVFS